MYSFIIFVTIFVVLLNSTQLKLSSRVKTELTDKGLSEGYCVPVNS